MKKFKMKSIFAFLATAMLAMMLVGCGGEKKDAAADAGKGCCYQLHLPAV